MATELPSWTGKLSALFEQGGITYDEHQAVVNAYITSKLNDDKIKLMLACNAASRVKAFCQSWLGKEGGGQGSRDMATKPAATPTPFRPGGALPPSEAQDFGTLFPNVKHNVFASITGGLHDVELGRLNLHEELPKVPEDVCVEALKHLLTAWFRATSKLNSLNENESSKALVWHQMIATLAGLLPTTPSHQGAVVEFVVSPSAANTAAADIATSAIGGGAANVSVRVQHETLVEIPTLLQDRVKLQIQRRIIQAGACEVANDLRTQELLCAKLQQVFKEAMSMWSMNWTKSKINAPIKMLLTDGHWAMGILLTCESPSPGHKCLQHVRGTIRASRAYPVSPIFEVGRDCVPTHQESARLLLWFLCPEQLTELTLEGMQAAEKRVQERLEGHVEEALAFAARAYSKRQRCI